MTENRMTMNLRLSNAKVIFIGSMPAPSEIAASLQELKKVLEWAESHQVWELVNSALWNICGCYSRQNKNSKAADALISLRTNLEQQRAGIEDPLRKGGVFLAYPDFFNVLCEKLQSSGRYVELLEAMEASKGRVIADVLTRQPGKKVEDKDIYNSVKRLPVLTKKYNFHYLSYYLDRFEDEATIYQVLVGKDGQVYGDEPVKLAESTMDAALVNVDPKSWGNCEDNNPARKIGNASMQLSPLVDSLSRLMKRGVLEKGDHLCYTADDNLNNLPLHYLPFHDEKVIEWFSLSKIHNSLQLELILEKPPSIPNKATAFIVPCLQDVESASWEKKHTSFIAPAKILTSYIPTKLMENEDVSVDGLKGIDLCNNLLHFSTHGRFTTDNPYEKSGLVISDGKSIPDKNLVSHERTDDLLSPEKIISNKLNFRGSHVTMMACVSILSREGVGGDALGLDWALTQAGASSILASHWMVGAADAARFFTLFYTKWLLGEKSRGHAFQDTVNELRSNSVSTTGAHCWAAFSLSGDWR